MFKLVTKITHHRRPQLFQKCISKLVLSPNHNCYSKLAHVENRSVLQLSGSDSVSFLQGLVTNDVEELENNSTMYAMMLNTQGRVQQDLLISKIEDDVLLLDCDRETLDNTAKILKRYKLRKKVDIDVRSDLKVFQAFEEGDEDIAKIAEASSVCSKDPRSTQMGMRILSSSLEAESRLFRDYTHFRICAGIPEGSGEFVVGKSLPFDYNLDLMNGVSFVKGCYIGQELTARTHFTGVKRKRVLPFWVIPKDENHQVISDNESIQAGDRVYGHSKAKKAAGKIVCVHGEIGLVVLKLDFLNDEPLTNKKRGYIKCFRPEGQEYWWPEDS